MGRPKKPANGEPNPVDLETRRRILQAAENLFISKGFKGVSMKNVADELEITAAALYYHFPEGKTDLFVEVVKNVLAEMGRGIAEASTSGTGVREKLKMMVLHLLYDFSEGKMMLMRDVNQQIQEEELRHLIWSIYGDNATKAIAEVFRQAAENGEVSQYIPPPLLAGMFVGMVFPLKHNPNLNGWRNDPVEADRLAGMMVSVILDGVGLRQPAIV
jgi:TetR/AcrR family transcriptional regulator, cholesterol catabolism regulator